MKKSKYRKTRFFKRLKKALNITNNDLKRKHLVKMNRYRRKYLIIEFNKFIDNMSVIYCDTDSIKVFGDDVKK